MVANGCVSSPHGLNCIYLRKTLTTLIKVDIVVVNGLCTHQCTDKYDPYISEVLQMLRIKNHVADKSHQ